MNESQPFFVGNEDNMQHKAPGFSEIHTFGPVVKSAKSYQLHHMLTVKLLLSRSRMCPAAGKVAI